jgi:pilus assembly protein CpaB
MKRRLITVILFAVLAAFISSTLLYKIISGNSPQSAQSKTTQVLVAARDLDAGSLVHDGDVRVAEWPAAEGSHWIANRSAVVGRALLEPLSKDEPFLESRLAAVGADASLASRIPPGMRVVAVHVDELTGLSRFILAGMHVDVISTGSAGNGQNVVARTILQNVEVLSTGQSAERDPKDKTPAVPVFNLLVTPQQAEVLSQAVVQSRIELVLRNPLDKGSFLSEVLPDVKVPNLAFPKPQIVRETVVEPKPPVEKKVAVVAPPPPPVAPPPPPPAPTLEIIHGNKRTVSTVAEPETKK